jgi:hypothetical protein
LNDRQQRQLVEVWLGSKEATAIFFEQLPPNLYALMGTPLLATLTAAVYKKNRYLPSTRNTIYALFADLLCGGWDAIKGINRGSHFGVYDKQLILRRLAGMNHFDRKRDVSIDTFKAAVRTSLPGLLERSDDLVQEIVRDGLMISTGTNLRFSHLSFQEFMAAADLREPGGGRASLALEKFLEGDDWWLEVLTFYVTGTSNPVEMERWIALRTKRLASLGRDQARPDQQLHVMCNALQAAFPAFRPEYPGGLSDLLTRNS